MDLPVAVATTSSSSPPSSSGKALSTPKEKKRKKKKRHRKSKAGESPTSGSPPPSDAWAGGDGKAAARPTKAAALPAVRGGGTTGTAWGPNSTSSPDDIGRRARHARLGGGGGGGDGAASRPASGSADLSVDEMRSAAVKMARLELAAEDDAVEVLTTTTTTTTTPVVVASTPVVAASISSSNDGGRGRSSSKGDETPEERAARKERRRQRKKAKRAMMKRSASQAAGSKSLNIRQDASGSPKKSGHYKKREKIQEPVEGEAVQLEAAQLARKMEREAHRRAEQEQTWRVCVCGCGGSRHSKGGAGAKKTSGVVATFYPRAPALWVFLFCTCVAAAVLATPSINAVPLSGPEEELRLLRNRCTLAVLAALVIISIGFELMQEMIHERAGQLFRPVVHALNSELTGLGFLAVCVYFIIKFQVLVIIGKPLFCVARFAHLPGLAGGDGDKGSSSDYATAGSGSGNSSGTQTHGGRRLAGGGGAECEVALLHLFEDVHMALFLVMVIFFVRMWMLIRSMKRISARWYDAERLAVDLGIRGSIRRLLEHYEKMGPRGSASASAYGYRCSSTCTCGRLMDLLGCRPCSAAARDLKKSRELLRFALLRHRFVETASASGLGLSDADFSFAEYLSLCASASASQIVDITAPTWVSILLYFTMQFFFMLLPPQMLLRAYCAFGFVLVAAFVGLRAHAAAIVAELVPPTEDITRARFLHVARLGRGSGGGRGRGRSSSSVSPQQRAKGKQVVPSPTLTATGGGAGRGGGRGGGRGRGRGRGSGEEEQGERKAEQGKGVMSLGPATASGALVKSGSSSSTGTTSKAQQQPATQSQQSRAGAALELYNIQNAALDNKTLDAICQLRPRFLSATHLHITRTANKHEQLFYGKRHGPAVLLFVFRLLMLLMVMYIALCFFLITSSRHSRASIYDVLFAPVAGFVVLCLNLSLPRQTLADIVVACNVEMLKKNKHVTEAVRTAKLKRSVRAIMLLREMRNELVKKQCEVKAQETAARKQRSASIAKAMSRRVSSGVDDMTLAATKLQASFRGHMFRKSKKDGNWATMQERARRDQEVKEAFAVFDKDGSGNISMDELGHLMRSLGLKIDGAARKAMFSAYDEDGDEEINFEEFKSVMYVHTQASKQSTDDLVKELFGSVDVDGTGQISRAEFHTAINNMNTQLTKQEIDSLINEVDVDNDGEIDLKEFSGMLKKYAR